MNYAKIYNDLIERSRLRDITDDYHEKHHIIPRCLDGKNSIENIAILTAREHYIAHQLLVKMYPDNKKLIYAANMMTVHDSDNRVGNRRYEWLRRKFSDSHPCKEPEIKDKIGKSLSTYFKTSDYIHKVALRRANNMEKRFCLCGCGSMFEVNRKNPKKYISASHAPRNTKRQSESLKETLSKLTKEEMSDRMKKSFGNCDPALRGSRISSAKKGKKTNQQEIMGRRYANMTDEEFVLFLVSRSTRIHKRISKLRNKWRKILSK